MGKTCHLTINADELFIKGLMAKTTILEANAPTQFIKRVQECFQYFDLLRMLSYRDIRVRYAQTYFGLAWAVLNPLISVVLLYFVFGIVAKVSTEGIPPLLYVMTGLLPWTYFARVVGEAGSSIISAQSLVKKIYFPRLIIPISKAVSGFVDLLVVLVMLAILLIIYQIPLKFQMLMFIPFLGMTVLAGIAFGIWIAALTIRFRDFSHIVPMLLRIGMFASPIAYSTVHVPLQYKWLFNLNPLTGIISGLRWSLFNTPLEEMSVIISLAVISLFLISGIWYFLRMDHYIADII